MIITIVLLIIGIMILAAGLYYLAKEKDRESRKVSGITTVIGAIIVIGALIKLLA